MTITPPNLLPSPGRVLIVGATGFIGHFIVQASLHAAHPTFVLVRSASPFPIKAQSLQDLQEKGAKIIKGGIEDQKLMEKILKECKIDIVISAVGGEAILDQLPLVRAIHAVGNLKRILPSEFGHEVDRADPVEPGLTMYKMKREVRRLVENLGIPYTYICCNSIASWPYCNNTHPSEVIPPLDHFEIYGSGTVKAYFVDGNDIGKFTMKTVEDCRTLNKSVHFRPPCNCLNINELASLWENKIGRTLPRVAISENDLLAAAAEKKIPESVVASITHDIFIKGCQINFEIVSDKDVEVGNLYPDESFRSMDECFNDFLVKIQGNLKLVDKEKHFKPVEKEEDLEHVNQLMG